jgi:hypothetical protein
MAQKDSGSTSFKKLLFLIRDWPNADEVSTCRFSHLCTTIITENSKFSFVITVILDKSNIICSSTEREVYGISPFQRFPCVPDGFAYLHTDDYNLYNKLSFIISIHQNGLFYFSKMIQVLILLLLYRYLS